MACGLGTGTHGGDFAFSGGCTSKVNEKLSINYAASMTMPGQDYAGDFEDQFSARAGFVWKLGKATKPSQITMKDKKVMEKKIESLEKENKTILSKNQKLENKLSTLMARLERLEKVALGDLKSKDLAVYSLK
ncbi:YadA-like family protein [Prochlorococcus marinus]|uniref:YadA-like family protein n=1 Tax=Prochlorococcus marinus TaxID=1219 RepID=UPI001F4C64BC|nr:YadA-like family protein [Prochlorococcus marinus]